MKPAITSPAAASKVWIGAEMGCRVRRCADVNVELRRLRGFFPRVLWNDGLGGLSLAALQVVKHASRGRSIVDDALSKGKPDRLSSDSLSLRIDLSGLCAQIFDG